MEHSLAAGVATFLSRASNLNLCSNLAAQYALGSQQASSFGKLLWSRKYATQSTPTTSFASDSSASSTLATSYNNKFQLKKKSMLYDLPLLFLRDACACSLCVDASSGQKNFQTTDIPTNITASQTRQTPTGIQITWANDVEGYEEKSHTSTYDYGFLDAYLSDEILFKRRNNLLSRGETWNRDIIARRLGFFQYKEYMEADTALFAALRCMTRDGIFIIQSVPPSKKAVEGIAERIGTIRDSFYGRTWNVESIPEARNVAYTSKYLGLHMDLLYMKDPPGLQLLHCLENTCQGGDSIFSDAFEAVNKLSFDEVNILTQQRIAYHYNKAGHKYYYTHPLIEVAPEVQMSGKFVEYSPVAVNYSPPFQAPFPMGSNNTGLLSGFGLFTDALRNFASVAQDEKNVFEFKLMQGECVVFNNRRVLHGRKSFDAKGGKRLLKGCYVDMDAFASRYRELSSFVKSLESM